LIRRSAEEKIFRAIMLISIALVIGSLVLLFIIVTYKGLSSLSISMITEVPKGGYYLGKEGGILNAIVGSFYLAGGAILLATVFSIPVVGFMNQYSENNRYVSLIRASLDIACGIPSLIYGAFAFLIMVALHQRASLMWGIITVALFITPILIRAMDEVMQKVSSQLKDASYALGATDLETLTHVVTKQAMPGIITAVILAFGRGIGDAASVLFTAGYTDNIPTSLSDPVATLPLAIFFQLSSPFPEVQSRAYASAVILLIIVLILCIGSRMLMQRFTRYTIK